MSDLPAGSPPVCPSCRQPDPQCDCPAEYVNEYKPPADRTTVAVAVDDDADDDAYGW